MSRAGHEGVIWIGLTLPLELTLYWTQFNFKTDVPRHIREYPLQVGHEGLKPWRKGKHRNINSTFTHLFSEALSQLSARVHWNPRKKLLRCPELPKKLGLKDNIAEQWRAVDHKILCIVFPWRTAWIQRCSSAKQYQETQNKTAAGRLKNWTEIPMLQRRWRLEFSPGNGKGTRQTRPTLGVMGELKETSLNTLKPNPGRHPDTQLALYQPSGEEFSVLRSKEYHAESLHFLIQNICHSMRKITRH